jgi:predicted Zn-dependent protease with MMP-like domain
MSSSDPARPAWATLQAPSLDELDGLAGEGFAALPDQFRTLIGDIEIRVADFPEEQVLDDLGIETEFDLLGLFQGTGLAHGPAVPFTGQLPNRIWLYRRPILDYWAEHEKPSGRSSPTSSSMRSAIISAFRRRHRGDRKGGG